MRKGPTQVGPSSFYPSVHGTFNLYNHIMTNIADIGALASYKTIEGAADFELVEKKSRFIAHAQHVEGEDEARAVIDEQKERYPDARHHVYAYVLRENNRVRYSDDGEPKRTAGLPVLDVIEHSELRDIVIVVTRYFGGTLLGTGGLVRAYTRAAQGALDQVNAVSLAACCDILVEVAYGDYDTLAHALEDMPVEILGTDYAATITLQIRCLNSSAEIVCEEIRDLTNGRAETLMEDPQMQLVGGKLTEKQTG